MVEKECDEDVADVVGPGEEQGVEVLLAEQLMHDQGALVQGEVVQGLEQEVQGAGSGDRVVDVEGDLDTREEEVQVEVGGEGETQAL